MSILDFSVETAGQSGQVPKIIYLNTNNTMAEVVATGYLNGLVEQGIPIAETDIALVVTRVTPNAASAQVSWFDVSKSGQDWSLSSTSASLTLPNGQIFVGNASNVATAVAMSGDITITNAGVTAIGAGVIVNADINAAAAIAYSKLASMATGSILLGNAGVATATALSGDITVGATGVTAIGAGKVLLAMLGSGIAPAGVVKFMGQHTTTGGSASEAFTVTGAVAATDRAFIQVVDNGTNNVSVLQAVVTTNTLTITFSGDPGADTIVNYQILRAAS